MRSNLSVTWWAIDELRKSRREIFDMQKKWNESWRYWEMETDGGIGRFVKLKKISMRLSSIVFSEEENYTLITDSMGPF